MPRLRLPRLSASTLADCSVMADTWVYVCPDLSAMQSCVGESCQPVCADNAGTWLQVQTLQPVPFDPSTLDPAELSAAFGAGFVAVSTLLIAVWAGSMVLEAIKQS